MSQEPSLPFGSARERLVDCEPGDWVSSGKLQRWAGRTQDQSFRQRQGGADSGVWTFSTVLHSTSDGDETVWMRVS